MSPRDPRLTPARGDEEDGWSLVQAARDGYVGWVAAAALARGTLAPTHGVCVKRTFVYPAPDMKQPILGALPLDAGVAVENRRGTFARIAGGWVVAGHLAPRGVVSSDYAGIAETLIGTPYLWGGKSPREGLRRGDLVFWRGHVGLMLDAVTLLHANAHHMLVAREPLSDARDRIQRNGGGDITIVRRLTIV